MGETAESNLIEFGAEGLIDATMAQIRGVVPRLSPEQRRVLERTIRRHAELRLTLIGATGRRRSDILTELAGLRATLSTLGEIAAVRAWQAIVSTATNVIVGALTVAI